MITGNLYLTLIFPGLSSLEYVMKVNACIVIALLIWGSFAKAEGPLPYDEHADPKADFAAALSIAGDRGKKILIIFGSNWCSDCRNFEQQLQQEPLKSLIDKKFIVVKADIGNWDKNMDFAARFGNPAEEGIPSIAVVDAARQRYFATRGGELTQARYQSSKNLTDWFAWLADSAPENHVLRGNF